MIGSSLVQRFFVACVTVLLAVLALQWATCVLQQIWPTLVVAGAVVVVITGVIAIIRWRRNRW